jgi:hypothetical protein
MNLLQPRQVASNSLPVTNLSSAIIRADWQLNRIIRHRLISLPTRRVRLQLSSHTTTLLLIDGARSDLLFPSLLGVEEVEIPNRRFVIGNGSEGRAIALLSSQEEETEDDEAYNSDAADDTADYGACVVGA